MNRSQLVRDWLIAERGTSDKPQDYARTGAQIAAGIGQSDDNIHVHYSVGQMYRDGILDRIGEARRYRYFLVRIPPPKFTAEEAKRRKAERQRNRNSARKKGVRPLAEWTAIRQQRKAERLAAKTAEREARFARTQEQRREPRERAESDRIARLQRPKPRLRPALKLAPDVPKPAPVAVRPLETVEEFEARGGRVQRLPSVWDSIDLAA